MNFKEKKRINFNEITFLSEKLTVDYISFKFQEFDDSNQTKIAKYLFKLGFNSFQEFGNLAKPTRETFYENSVNKFKVDFIRNNPFWAGTVLNFSGKNAEKFYSFVQKEKIDWSIFSLGIFCRFDLYYLRTQKVEDKISMEDFLYQSLKEIKQTKQKVSLEKNTKGWILKIGNRGSSLFYRIYQQKNSLKFELEMKGKFLQKYHSLLVENQLEEFENNLCSHFFSYSAKTLPLNYSYMDWLLRKVRPNSCPQFSNNSLNSHYISENSFESFEDRKDFLCFLQFLIFVQKLDCVKDSLGNTFYREITFKLQDFWKYQNSNLKVNYSYYQTRKLIAFFDKLQKNSLIQTFSDDGFRNLVAIPEVKVKKNKQNILIVKVWIAEELFCYLYPFALPNFLIQKACKDRLEVQFKFIKTFSSPSLEKKFLIQEFLKSYPALVSNQRKTKIKRLFLELVTSLKNADLIQSKYKVISDGNWKEVSELTISNISEGFIIYEKLFLP